MALSFHTTTISVLRRAAGAPDDPYDEQPERSTIAEGVKAHISTSTGYENIGSGAEQSVADFRLTCEPTDLTKADWVLDENTGAVYDVEWAALRRGLGLDHTRAGLQIVEGVL